MGGGAGQGDRASSSVQGTFKRGFEVLEGVGRAQEMRSYQGVFPKAGALRGEEGAGASHRFLR